MKADLNFVDRKRSEQPGHNLDSELPDRMIPLPMGPWPESGYKAWPEAKRGALLGGIAGCTSLLTNIIGSVLWPAISGQAQHPLRIIQVYLTFPLGQSALNLDSGTLLAVGCLLYLATGILYGMLFEVVLSYLLPHANALARLMACTILALCLWAINFYAVLIWLQPLLFGGRWIIDLIPWWVGAATHLVFGWTIALLYEVRPYKLGGGANETA
ncbi:MAG TPA: hypothetical protein VHE81_00525 [Lacipirellulaceae bacterium]|nr:hypothetical protein [Lacipirellulaceae bacterium]